MALNDNTTTADTGRIGKPQESARHTTGPWIVVDDIAGANSSGPYLAVENADRSSVICEIESPDDSPELCRADAALIAAAPDLLAACKATFVTVQAIVDAHEAEPFRTELDPAARFQNDLRNSAGLLRAAIAKARGGSAVQS